MNKELAVEVKSRNVYVNGKCKINLAEFDLKEVAEKLTEAFQSVAKDLKIEYQASTNKLIFSKHGLRFADFEVYSGTLSEINSYFSRIVQDAKSIR